MVALLLFLYARVYRVLVQDLGLRLVLLFVYAQVYRVLASCGRSEVSMSPCCFGTKGKSITFLGEGIVLRHRVGTTVRRCQCRLIGWILRISLHLSMMFVRPTSGRRRSSLPLCLIRFSLAYYKYRSYLHGIHAIFCFRPCRSYP